MRRSPSNLYWQPFYDEDDGDDDGGDNGDCDDDDCDDCDDCGDDYKEENEEKKWEKQSKWLASHSTFLSLPGQIFSQPAFWALPTMPSRTSTIKGIDSLNRSLL